MIDLEPDPYADSDYSIDWSMDPSVHERNLRKIEWAPAFKAAFESTASKIILSGGVGSGKTLAGMKMFIERLLMHPHDAIGLITLYSQESAKDNIFSAIEKLGYEWRESSYAGSSVEIEGRLVHMRSLRDITSQARIRGMTYACWYADEITLQKRDAVMQAIQRIRAGKNVSWIWSTNPDSQDHWVYREFITNPAVAHFSFKTADNLDHLPMHYIEDLPCVPGTSLYRQIVDGEWCANDTAPFYDLQRCEPRGEYRYMYLDPALGGGDYTAVALISSDSGDILGHCWRKSWYDCMVDMQKLFEKYQVDFLVYEKNSLGTVLDSMVERGALPWLYGRLEGYTTSMNKALKISRLTGLIKSGDIRLSVDSDDEFVRQVVNWTPEKTARGGDDHDDAPDVIASALLHMGYI